MKLLLLAGVLLFGCSNNTPVEKEKPDFVEFEMRKTERLELYPFPFSRTDFPDGPDLTFTQDSLPKDTCDKLKLPPIAVHQAWGDQQIVILYSAITKRYVVQLVWLRHPEAKYMYYKANNQSKYDVNDPMQFMRYSADYTNEPERAYEYDNVCDAAANAKATYGLMLAYKAYQQIQWQEQEKAEAAKKARQKNITTYKPIQ